MAEQPTTFFDAAQIRIAEPPDTFEIHGKRYVARSWYERLLVEIDQLKKQIKSYEQTEKSELMATTNCTCANCQKVWDNVADNVRYDYTTSTTSVASGNTPTVIMFDNAAKAKSDFAPNISEPTELNKAYNKLILEFYEAQKKISCQNEEIEKRDETIKQFGLRRGEDLDEINRLMVALEQRDQVFVDANNTCNDLIRQLQERDEQVAHLQAQLSTSNAKPDYNSLLGSYEAANAAIKEVIEQKLDLENDLADMTDEWCAMCTQNTEANIAIRRLAELLALK